LHLLVQVGAQRGDRQVERDHREHRKEQAGRVVELHGGEAGGYSVSNAPNITRNGP
jgi:hypothetical protein